MAYRSNKYHSSVDQKSDVGLLSQYQGVDRLFFFFIFSGDSRGEFVSLPFTLLKAA